MYNCSAYDDRISTNSGIINCQIFWHSNFLYILILKIEAHNNNATVGLIHVRPSCKTEAEAGACKSDSGYMNTICDKSFCTGKIT